MRQALFLLLSGLLAFRTRVPGRWLIFGASLGMVLQNLLLLWFLRLARVWLF